MLPTLTPAGALLSPRIAPVFFCSQKTRENEDLAFSGGGRLESKKVENHLLKKKIGLVQHFPVSNSFFPSWPTHLFLTALKQTEVWNGLFLAVRGWQGKVLVLKRYHI